MFDIDGGGSITMQELANHGNVESKELPAEVKALILKLPTEVKALQALMTKYDTDGNGDIDFDEFKAMMAGDKVGLCLRVELWCGGVMVGGVVLARFLHHSVGAARWWSEYPSLFPTTHCVLLPFPPLPLSDNMSIFCFSLSTSGARTRTTGRKDSFVLRLHSYLHS